MKTQRTKRLRKNKRFGFERLESRCLLTGEVFFDDFNRPDGEIANGWSSFVTGNGVPLAIANGVATNPNTNLGPNASPAAGIHRSFPVGDVTLVSGILYETMGASGFGSRFEAGAFVGSNGQQHSGFGVIVGRSSEWNNDSSIYIYFNGVLLNTIRSPFQFRNELQFNFSFSRAGDVSGRITEDQDEFLFQSTHELTEYEGNEVMLWAASRDDRGHPGPLPRIDDVRIESDNFDFDLQITYDGETIPDGGNVNLGEIVAWEDASPKFISVRNNGQYSYHTEWIEFPESFTSHYSIDPIIQPNEQINIALMPTNPGDSVGDLRFGSLNETLVKAINLRATSDTDRTQIVIYFEDAVVKESILRSNGWLVGQIEDLETSAFQELYDSTDVAEASIDVIMKLVKRYYSPFNADVRRGNSTTLSVFTGRKDTTSHNDEDTVMYVTSNRFRDLFPDLYPELRSPWGLAGGAEREMVSRANRFDDIAFVFARAFELNPDFEEQVAFVIAHEAGHTFGLPHSTTDSNSFDETQRHEMMNSGASTGQDYQNVGFLDMDFARATGEPLSSHRYLFGFDQNGDELIDDSERGTLGPSSHSWVASLVPGVLEIRGNESNNLMKIELQVSRWSVSIDTELFAFDAVNPLQGSFYIFNVPLGGLNVSLSSGRDELQVDSQFPIPIRANGGSDDDILFGGAAEDLLIGGHGIDHIFGQNGNDHISGGDGSDFLFGDSGDDFLRGDSQGDELHGGLGNDMLDGGQGVDKLFGDEGLDSLFGGLDLDIDQLWGGQGSDVFVLIVNDWMYDFEIGIDKKERFRVRR